MLLFLILTAQSFPVVAMALQQGHLRHETFSVQDGLSQNSIWSALQDRKGFLWFGTADGLNRYDGYTFTTYRTIPGDSTSLSNNTIWALCQDDSGAIWIGTSNGVNRYDSRTARFSHLATEPRFAKLPLAEMTTSLLADKEGNIWCGRYRGIFFFNPLTGLFKIFDHTELPFAPGPVGQRLLLFARNGDVWLTNGMHLYRFAREGHLLQRVPFTERDIRVGVIAMFEDRYGILWCATRENGLWQYNHASGQWKTLPLPHLGTNKSISAINEDAEGRLWIGTAASGLYYTDPGTTVVHSFRPSSDGTKNARYEGVKNILRDRSGLLWVGYDGAGGIRINPHPDKFRHVLLPPSTTQTSGDNFFKALLVDHQGAIWLGTYDQGLNILDPSGAVRRFRYTTTGNGLRSNTVLSLHQDREGDVWIGTLNGIDRFDRGTGTFRHYSLAPHASQPAVTWLCSDSAGTLWCGTARQILRYNPSTDRFMEVLSSERAFTRAIPPMINVIAPASNGLLWVGTHGGGLLKMRSDGTILRRYAHDGTSHSLSNNTIKTILLEPDGMLWIGTEGGLNRFDPSTEQWRTYHTSDGLPNDVVYGLLMDQKKRLWISTNRGISRMETTEADKPRFRNYTPDDGLQSYEFNTNTYFQAPNGEMFFGGVNGFNRFFPDSILDNPVVPPVVLTGFKKFDVPVHLEPDISVVQEIVLEYGESVFSIEYAATEFTNPQANRYRYKLEGFDKEWVNAGRRREARYTNLDPGSYIFRVNGSNNDGIWNERGASVRIRIVPPFWKTEWFLGLMIVFGMVTVGGAVRFISTQKLKKRIAQLEREKEIQEERLRTRERIARDLHDDLASTVGSAGFFVESIKTQLKNIPPQSRKFLNKTSALLSEAEEAMSDIVWSVSPEHDTLESLIARIRLTTADLCRASRIEYEVTIPNGPLQSALPEQTRRNIYLVFKEALTNAVRHSGASVIAVSLLMESGELTLTVRDNGKGLPAFQPPNAGTKRGHGMRNMRKRADEMQASLSFAVSSPSGTVVTVRVRITQIGHCSPAISF